jgi:anaerobic dimethyl sulfoxide reductase subunit B (iron-sulfur subunit)
MQKCELCLERWSQGKKPTCVEACLLRALDAGPVGELGAKYGEAREGAGFVYSCLANPAIFMKGKRKKT